MKKRNITCKIDKYFRKLSDIKVLNDNLNEELNIYNEKIGEILKQIEVLKEAEKKAKRPYNAPDCSRSFALAGFRSYRGKRGAGDGIARN